MEEWSGTVRDEAIKAIGVIALFLVLLALALVLFEGDDPWFIALFIGGPATVFLVVIPIMSWLRYRRLWHHISLNVYREFDDVLEALDGVLGGCGRGDRRRSRFPKRVMVTYDCGRMTVVAERFREFESSIYLGPLEDGTSDDVERLKDLVEGALAPPHHHEGNE